MITKFKLLMYLLIQVGRWVPAACPLQVASVWDSDSPQWHWATNLAVVQHLLVQLTARKQDVSPFGGHLGSHPAKVARVHWGPLQSQRNAPEICQLYILQAALLQPGEE